MSVDITPEEIKRIRGKYGLSQKAFARILGIGDASIVRYENGSKPTRAIANLIRAVDNEKFMLDCLERSRDVVSDEQAEKVEKIVYSTVQFDERGEIMGMTEIYEVTLQQEILNEQAAEILADIFRMKRMAQKKGDESLAAIYSDIANQVAIAKHEIVSSKYDSLIGVAEIRGRIKGLMDIALMTSAKAA